VKPIRNKRGRTTGGSLDVRRTHIEPAPAGTSLGIAGARVLDLLAARDSAEQRHRAEGTERSKQARNAARGRLNDALDHLRRTKGLRREVGALLGALAADGGSMLETYAAAHEDYRSDLRRAVLSWAEVIERRRVDDPATMELLARAHLEAGVSAALRRRVLRLPIDAPEAAALREEARRAGNASRLDMLSGLAMASAAAVLNPPPTLLDALLAEDASEDRPASASAPPRAPSAVDEPTPDPNRRRA